MRKLAAAFLAVMLTATGARATGLPIPFFGPGFDPTNQAANFNTLIQEINAVLLPLLPQIGPGQINNIQLVGTASGTSPYITIAPGGDANSSIKIVPVGNGNIVLFDALMNQYSTGNVKIGNLASWVPIQGLAACPGILPGHAPFGMADHITGYWITKDWLDRQGGLARC